MNIYYKDILIVLLLILGLTGFIFGEFIISSVLFASAAIASNLFRKEIQNQYGQAFLE